MKTKKKKIIPLLVLGLIVTSTIGVCTNLNFLNNRKEETINSETITNTNGISIKRITQGKDSSGNPTQTFSYTIEPETSTYQKVNVSLAYKDGSDCSTAMKANVNLENKTITLTCLSDFDMQIILTVTSDFDSDISASATIDYEKKLTSFSFDIDGLNSSLKDEPWSSEYEGNFFFDEYIDETYSKHTINKEFTYQVNINSIESTSPSGSSSILKTIYNLGGNGIEFIQDLRNLMLESFFIDNSFPTANQIWNLTEDENIRKKLLTISSENIYDPFHELSLGYDSFIVNELTLTYSDGQVFTINNIDFGYSIIDLPYSNCYTAMEGLIFEENSFIF